MDIAYEVIFLEAAQIGEKYMPAQKKFRDSIHAKGTEITVLSTGDSNDYISLTDIARYKSDAPDDVIKNWMRNRDTIEFLGLWEQLNNPDFKPVEFDGFRTQAGSNAFTMSPKKWVEATGPSGSFQKQGAMVARLRKRILRLNLLRGSQLSSSCISLRTISD